jgi:glycosyltransferase involved in cell wall biosynthesis
VRVVFLNPVGVLGGGERSLLDLLAALGASGAPVEPSLIVGTDGPLITAAQRFGCEVHLLPMSDSLASTGDSAGAIAAAARAVRAGADVNRYATQMSEAIRELRPDVVHSNGIKTHLLTRLCGGLDDTPVIWHVRDFVGARPMVGRLMRWALREKITSVIANSRAVADDVARTLGRKSARVTIDVVYNGIDTETFSPGRGDGAWLDELANLPPLAAGSDTIRVGLVATYARWKGHDLLMRAAQLVRAGRPKQNIRFYVVGGAIYRTAGSQFSEVELRTMARDLEVDGIVGFVPFQDEPVEVYRALDVVVHASTQPEPFGRTIVEAMACGRAVIVANAGGAAELFTDGVDAVGVAPGDASALAEASLRLAGAPELRRQLGERARQTAVQRFNRRRLADQILAVYRRVTAPPAGKVGKT